MPVEIESRINPNLVRNVSRKVLHVFSKDITLSGENNIPMAGPAIIAANHMGILEVVPPYAYSPETPVMFTKRENLRIPLLGSFLKSLGAIPVNRDEIDRQALRLAIEVLVNQKRTIFTCPEGTRGRDKFGNRTELKKGKSGIIYIAQKAANELNKPILISPWAIWGTEGIFPQITESVSIKKRFMLHRDHVFISVGLPYFVYPSDQKLTKESMQVQIDAVMRQIKDMLPVKYHGYYAEK